jgi:hypothetical protein
VKLLAALGILSELADERYAKALHTDYGSVPLAVPVFSAIFDALMGILAPHLALDAGKQTSILG